MADDRKLSLVGLVGLLVGAGLWWLIFRLGAGLWRWIEKVVGRG